MRDFVMWRSEGSWSSKHKSYWLNATYFWRPHLASGFPTGFTADSRTRVHTSSAELQYSQLAKHRWDAEAAGAAGVHLVTPPQEMPYALIDVVINRLIRRGPSSVTEVRRPAPQYLIQPASYLLPGPRVTGYQ